MNNLHCSIERSNNNLKIPRCSAAGYFIKSVYNDLTEGNSINLFRISNYVKRNIFFLLKILCLCVIPVIIGLLWVRYSDFIKAQSIYTQSLMSENMKAWNYGTIRQKMEFYVWGLIFDRIHRYFAPYLMIGLLPISVYGLYKLEHGKDAILFYMSIPVAVILTLFSLINLYYRHDYYLIAISPYICIIFGLGFYYACFEMTKNKILLKFVFFLLFSISVLQPMEYMYTLFYSTKYIQTLLKLEDKNNGEIAVLGDYINRTTNKDELILVQDQDWSSALLYASNRRGFMRQSDYNIDASFLTSNNFTKYVKRKDTKFYSNILDNFNVTLEQSVFEYEIYKLSRLK